MSIPPPLPEAPAGDRVREALRRVKGSDPRIWLSRPHPDMLAQAAPIGGGPLAGRLLAVKDNVDVCGMPTTAGCRAFAYDPDRTAPAVAALERAGALVLGKATMDMFATGLTGTRGPDGPMACALAPQVVSGGSSSGSALAVAYGLADIGVGTDTAGSGRVPAAFNGIVGLKPTRGLISTAGVVPACRSLDCVSVFTHTVGEAYAALAAATDPMGRSQTRCVRADLAATSRPRIGVPIPERLEFFGDDEPAALFAAAVERMAGAGAELVPIDPTPLLAAGRLLYEGPWVAERYAAVGAFVAAHPEAVDPVVREVILRATARTAVDAYEGAYRLEELVADAATIWRNVDAVMVPTTVTAPTIAAVAADPHGEQARLGRYTNFVNLMDLCAVSVPAGRWASGAGFGVQFIAPAFADPLICALAERFVRTAPAQTIAVAVVGAHLKGQPLNHQLTSRGAFLTRTTRTAAIYDLYALTGTDPPKPALQRCGAGGAAIEVEVWSVPAATFGSFVAQVPPPLGIGTLTLEDGAEVCGFISEAAGLIGAERITDLGGWRAYLARRG